MNSSENLTSIFFYFWFFGNSKWLCLLRKHYKKVLKKQEKEDAFSVYFAFSDMFKFQGTDRCSIDDLEKIIRFFKIEFDKVKIKNVLWGHKFTILIRND